MTTTTNPTTPGTIGGLPPATFTIAQQGSIPIRGVCYQQRTNETALIRVFAEKHVLYAPHSHGLNNGRSGYLPGVCLCSEAEGADDTIVTFDEHKDWEVFAVYQSSADDIAVALSRPRT